MEREKEVKDKELIEKLKESEEQYRIFASYQYAISELRKFYIVDATLEQMVQETLDLIVKKFGYYMAWYAELIEEEKVILPKLWAGKYEKYLDGLRLEFESDKRDAKCAMSIAILTKKPFGYADIEHDKDFEKWRAFALQYGYRSNHAIPLIIDGECKSAFLIYSTRPFAFSENLIEYLKGIVNELATIIENITKRKKLIDELKKAQNNLEKKVRQRTAELEVARAVSENIIENANTLIMAGNTKAELTIFNKAYEDFTGYKKEEVLGRPFPFLMPEEEREKHLNTFKDVFKDKNIRDYEITILTKKGEKRNTLFNSALISDKEGNRMVIGIGYDITGRKKAEEELQRVAEEWKTTFDSTMDMILINGKDYKIIRANKSFADFLKMKPEELTGKVCYEVVHRKKEPWPTCPHKQALDTKKPASAAFFEPHLGIYLELSASPIFNEKGEVIASVHIAKDITERKKAEEELKKAYDDLKEAQARVVQSEKLASLGQMAAGAAHEIDNPLFAILGEAEMLSKDEKKDKDTKDTAKIIIEQSERIKGIIERLLEFARKKEPKLGPADINKLLEKSISLLEYQTKLENIEIVKELDPELPTLSADNDQIQEVFLNIMLNAVQAMEEVGRLTIRTHSEKITEYGRRKTDIFKLGEEIAVIEFKDTGKGMDGETLKKMFDPFFSTKEKNTGLGLSICHGIVENHNGIIEAHSKLGEGATFVVKLPVLKNREKG